MTFNETKDVGTRQSGIELLLFEPHMWKPWVRRELVINEKITLGSLVKNQRKSICAMWQKNLSEHLGMENLLGSEEKGGFEKPCGSW